jgi:hypothetical protein
VPCQSCKSGAPGDGTDCSERGFRGRRAGADCSGSGGIFRAPGLSAVRSLRSERGRQGDRPPIAAARRKDLRGACDPSPARRSSDGRGEPKCTSRSPHARAEPPCRVWLRRRGPATAERDNCRERCEGRRFATDRSAHRRSTLTALCIDGQRNRLKRGRRVECVSFARTTVIKIRFVIRTSSRFVRPLTNHCANRAKG